MNVRTVVAAVTLLVVAWGFGRWSAVAPAPIPETPTVTPQQTPGATPRVAEPLIENVSEAPVFAALTPGKPVGVPDMAPYSGFGEDVERVIPDDTEPVLFKKDWREGLTPDQVRLYAEGLVRSGLEDIGLCKSGYTCHVNLKYRVDEQNRSDYPHAIWLHATFMTRTRHEELYWYYEGSQTRVWVRTEAGWRYDGIVEDLPEQTKMTQVKLMASSFIKN